MLPFNRPGNTLGPAGRTLTDIYEALLALGVKIDALAAATPPAVDLSAITDAIGSRADCDTGESVIGLLCRIAGSIETFDGFTALPPVSCDGYTASAGNTFYLASWYRPETTLSGPDSSWYGFYQEPPISSTNISSETFESGYSPASFPTLTTSTDLANFCIAWDTRDTGIILTLDQGVVGNPSPSFSAPLNSSGEAETGSFTYAFDIGEWIAVRAYVIGEPLETAPVARVWFTQGAFG